MNILPLILLVFLGRFRSQSSNNLLFPNGNQSKLFAPGDILNHYQLIQRIEQLGIQKQYHHDEAWDQHYVQNLLLSYTAYQTKSNTTSTIWPIAFQSNILNVNKNCELRNQSYCLDENIFNGGHGEIWRAHKIIPGQSGVHSEYLETNTTYILKRMKTKDRPDILRCALREIYYGTLLHSEMIESHGMKQHYIARLEGHFMIQDDYWLVFRYEGVSLQSLFYAVSYHEGSHSAVLKPSKTWKKLRTTQLGLTSMRNLLHQLIERVGSLHRKGITHRDLKPSNILLNTEDDLNPVLIIADFSSAVSHDTLHSNDYFYPKHGPTIQEETLLYAPPEVLLSIDRTHEDELFQHHPTNQSDRMEGIPYHYSRSQSYDIWSIGVIWLEMILGTGDVFSPDQRTVTLLLHKLQRKYNVTSSKMMNNAILLATLSEFCIYDGDQLSSDVEAMDEDLHAIAPMIFIPSDSGDIQMQPWYVGSSLWSPESQYDSLYDASHGQEILSKRLISYDDDGFQCHTTSDITYADTGTECTAYSWIDYDSISPSSTCSVSLQDLYLSIEERVEISFEMVQLHQFSNENQLPHIHYLPNSWKTTFPDPVHPMKHKDDLESRKFQQFLRDQFSSKQRKKPLETVSGSPSSLTTSQSGRCSIKELQNAVLRRDPLGIGFHDPWGLDLLSKLLKFNPNERISLEEALDHNYFKASYESYIDESAVEEADEWRDDVSGGGDALTIDDRDFLETEEMDDSVISPEISSRRMSQTLQLINLTKLTEWTEPIQTPSFHSNELLDSALSEMEFSCDRCGRVFRGDYQSCLKHAKVRKHGHKCSYAIDSGLLPACLSDHFLLPVDELSGWCDLQGRRRYMEDWHAVYFTKGFKFFAVFDGHFGSVAARFASHHIYGLFHHFLTSHSNTSMEGTEMASIDSKENVETEMNDWEGDEEDLTSDEMEDPNQAASSYESSRIKAANPLYRHIYETIDPFHYSDASALSRDSSMPRDPNSENHQHNLLRAADELYPSNWCHFLRIAPLNSVVMRLTITDPITGQVSILSKTAVDVIQSMRQSFLLTDQQLHTWSRNHSILSSSDNIDHSELNLRYLTSGSTAAVAVFFSDQKYLMIAHVGDSRIVACCDWMISYNDEEGVAVSGPLGNAMQLTMDHTPYNANESLEVIRRGGWIDKSDDLSQDKTQGIWRVNSKLAITRSLGDVVLGDVLSPDPDIIILDLNLTHHDSTPDCDLFRKTVPSPTSTMCQSYQQFIMDHFVHPGEESFQIPNLQFLIIASDGLWDVMSNQDATEFVCENLLEQYKKVIMTHQSKTNGVYQSLEELAAQFYHHVSRNLALEALIRGSTDNVGVCIVDLLHYYLN